MCFCLDEVELYLQNILKVRLLKYGVSVEFLQNILSNVREQTYSLIKVWGDAPIRRGLCVIGAEEGIFYSPTAKPEIKCFVVVSIRNSFIECIHSENFRKTGLLKHIPGNPMKEITQEAIVYFNKFNFYKLCEKMSVVNDFNYYQKIIQNYPAAWCALKQIGSSNAKKISYPSVSSKSPQIPELDSFSSTNTSIAHKSYFDGMSEEIDEPLIHILKSISDAKMDCFYVDSFKCLTRNFRKFMKVFEFILTNNTTFMTSNYFITNGYIEKRDHLIRASHSSKDLEINLHNTEGLCYYHKMAFKKLIEKTKDKILDF